ncbi:MAG TPA: tellurium resistance protein TerC [Candidatus Marinimicrobia bacterium]|nr:tellurium resistance protein TerC [Candidatus Neomarinimicrobiota bacterium]HIB33358.1 tellurium resistance protein TerC [Candidatus Neomarinimicrobiota bacterium]
MNEIFTFENFITLLFLILLQAVLGFDNLLYISLESKKAPLDKQPMVRRWGIGIAIFLRISLLFVLIKTIDYFKDPFININVNGIVHGEFNVHSLIVLLGGIFIIYTSMKEISHMLIMNVFDQESAKTKSVRSVVTWIVLMNLVFSFDSILSAMALSDVFAVMAFAIIFSGFLMIYLADTVAVFLQKNRMYEVLGLFILFVVGIMLVSDGGHLASLHLFGQEITPMNKTTFYFIITILILTDIVQTKYQKNLLRHKSN